MDVAYMRQAIELARSDQPHPNPRVGAVVVAGDEIVGQGSHVGPGHRHAEVVALAAAEGKTRGATLYVTLEPCDHQGRTPPCTDAILASGVARVVVAVGDPDRQVAGRGVARLRAAGLDVVEGVLSDEAVRMDAGYFHHRRTGRPLVTVKWAATLDGSLAAADGSSQWITSPDARLDAHRLRASADAVMVGAGTAIADDPSLTVRMDGYAGRQPAAVIVVGRRTLPGTLRIWERGPIVLTSSAPPAGDSSATFIAVPGEAGVSLPDGLERLAAAGIVDLLVEGGARLLGSFFRAGLVDRGVVYYGARLGLGAGLAPIAGTFAHVDDARPVRITDVRTIGTDVRVEFETGEG